MAPIKLIQKPQSSTKSKTKKPNIQMNTEPIGWGNPKLNPL